MAWVWISVEIFFHKYFSKPSKKGGIRVNQGCLQHCLTFRYIKISVLAWTRGGEKVSVENGKIVASVTIPLYRLHSSTIDVDKPKQVVMFGKEKKQGDISG